MNADLEAVAAATAAVFVAGSRVGSAVLVDGRHLLTAAHVLRRGGDEVELVFPSVAARHGGRVAARRSPPEADAGWVDAAVLDVGPAVPPWLPRPVSLWTAGRLPTQVCVLGFPLAERALRGVWRDFDVSGPVSSGSIQLDWAGDRGTLPGHSGGPVVERTTGALVGILVEGSERGLFDRFVPLTSVHSRWPQLPRPWHMAGSAARDHFIRRACGQRSTGRGGDLFRGREAALTAVRTWLCSEEAPGRVLVVTGQPGAGKSAVTARAALGLEAEGRGPGLAFHARGATLNDFITAVADLAGVASAGSPDALIEAIDSRSDDRWIVVVDALDEAASAADRQRMAETLEELAALPGLRVAVATRALAAGDRYGQGSLLGALGASAAGSPNLVDLDTDRYFDASGLREFAAALLAQDGALHPGPQGAAWTRYRSDARLRDRLARVVGARAGRNHLVVALAAVPLSKADGVIDPADPVFDLRSLPSGVGEALGKYLETLPDRERVRSRALLTALAYARGEGIDDRMWLRFAAALGYASDVADLDRLRDSAAADYLQQSVAPGAGRVTRLFHQALNDELLAGRHRPGDERALLETLLPPPGGRGWTGASIYACKHAAEHAAVSDELLRLVDDARYLGVADLIRLLPLLSPPERFGSIAAVLRRAGLRAAALPPARRTRLLALTAAHLGLAELRDRLGEACDEGFAPRWAHSLGAAHQKLTGHTGAVTALALGRIGQREVVVSGSDDGTVRLWDAGSGESLGAPLAGHSGWVSAVALGTIGERRVIVSGGRDSTVRIWDAASGEQIVSTSTGHIGWVSSVALGRVGEHQVIVSGGDDGTVRIREAGGEAVGGALVGHVGWVRTVALGRVGEREVVVSGGGDSTVRIWDATTGGPLGAPLTGHTGGVRAVAVGRVGEREVIVSGSIDRTVRLWDAASGEPLGAPLAGHADWVSAVALGTISGREVIVSGSDDGTVRIWDAASGAPLGAPLGGHTGWVRAVAVGRVGKRDVIVSGGDRTVRVWDAAGGEHPGVPLAGHTHWVRAAAVGRIGDREVIVSGGDGGTVRTWDAAGGEPVGVPLVGHTGRVSAVAVGRAGERDVIVSGGGDSTVRIWDASTGASLGAPLAGHTTWVSAVALHRVGERDVIVSGSEDGTLRVWDAAGGEPLGVPLVGHSGWVCAVAVGRIGEREVIVSGGGDGMVRVWDAAGREQIGAPLVGHAGWVTAVALGSTGGREVIVTGGDDGTVRIWDAASGTELGTPQTGQTGSVTAVALGRVREREVVVSGGEDGTVRIWDAERGSAVVLDFLEPVSVVMVSRQGAVWAATGTALCLLRTDGERTRRSDST